MLKHRLIFGTLMTVLFVGLVFIDAWLDGSATASALDDRKIKATILTALVALMLIAGQFELARLAREKTVKILLPVSIVSSVLLAATAYWLQFFPEPTPVPLLLLLAFSTLALFLYQALRHGIEGALQNIAAGTLAILYLGLLAAFVPAIRIRFGPWHLLAFVFVVKSADIGAYTAGRLFGKHKFSPKISAGKTWEGMAGAVVAAVIVAVSFALASGIMVPAVAAVFGLCFAWIGQLGDLAESLIKRDVEQKDSANTVPGFGGILDVVDSLLAAAPFAYLFFLLLP